MYNGGDTERVKKWRYVYLVQIDKERKKEERKGKCYMQLETINIYY